MRIVAKTDIGMKRSSNQDSYAAGELPDGVAWAVVCDGMGGAAGGNVASSNAVKIISERITSAYRPKMSPNSIKNMLISAITAANISVFDMSRTNAELDGMGTTVVCSVVTNGVAHIAHAGDSRAYAISNNKVYQLTKDHSVVQELVERGQITENEAKNHPRKNIITRALGVDSELKIDYCEYDMNENDILVLCTDGFTNFVDDEQFLNIVENNSYYEIADKLVTAANDNGGADNITVVALSY
ncbi:MAG: Stp1/IreP family PP2C-type Ser/Thr phosphatase [Clostridiaceae bacterium]|nr:Stp1/IreP family PP2C-type Ser/Thr phosphatase [Clostridiaceae bacterium]